MPRLASILSPADFAQAEQGAMVLDGEAYRVDGVVAPVDEIPGPLLRAASLVARLPPGLIAEQHSAAWIWGAQLIAPDRHEVCADITARTRPTLDRLLRVREVVLPREDAVSVAGLRVTTPLRTAIDLARFEPDWNAGQVATVCSLLGLAGVTLADCDRFMNRRRNLPNKRIALERLADCLGEAIRN